MPARGRDRFRRNLGKLPNPVDSMESRYELLIPLGASFIMYYGLEFVFYLRTLGYSTRILLSGSEYHYRMFGDPES